MTPTGGGGDITVASTSITAGQPFTINTFTLTAGNERVEEHADMAVILDIGTLPQTFASGNFPLATFNSGPAWRFTLTPTNASGNPSYYGFHALFATNDNGGLWLVRSGADLRIELYNGSGSGTLVAASFSAGQGVTVTINLAAITNASSIVISGATSGNGTTNFTTSGTYFTASTLGVGTFSDTNTFNFAGGISDVDDTVPFGGDANITLASGTLSSTGSIDVSGAAAITLAGATAIGEDIPGPKSGEANITLDAASSTGSIDVSRAAAIQLAGDRLTAAGPPGMSIGATTVKQRIFGVSPTSGTFTTDPVYGLGARRRDRARLLEHGRESEGADR